MPDNDEALRAATVNIMIAYQTLISQKRFIVHTIPYSEVA